jgi:hypothetical protein
VGRRCLEFHDAEEYIVVDDFESYTDDIEAAKAIFDAWLDGWVNGEPVRR